VRLREVFCGQGAVALFFQKFEVVIENLGFVLRDKKRFHPADYPVMVG
jgi:hypothetical protein